MDQTRFDEWTKRFGTALNRRQLLRGVIGGVGAITLTRVSEQGAGAQSPCDASVGPVTCPPTTFNSGLIKIPNEGCCTVSDDCCTNYCHHGLCIFGDGSECLLEGSECENAYPYCCRSLECIAGYCQPAGACVGVSGDCSAAACCGDLMCIDGACGYELPKTGRAAIRAARSRSLLTTALVGGTVSLLAATMLRKKPPVAAAPIQVETVPSVLRVGAAFEQTSTVVYDTADPAADLSGVRFTIDRYDVSPALEFKQRAAELSNAVGSRRVVGYAFGDQALLFSSSKGTPAPDAWLLVRDGRYLEQWYVAGDNYVATRLFSLANAHYATPRGQTMTERRLRLSELPKGFKETCTTYGNPSILCREYEREGIVRSVKR
jgi:hypothetical protein